MRDNTHTHIQTHTRTHTLSHANTHANKQIQIHTHTHLTRIVELHFGRACTSRPLHMYVQCVAGVLQECCSALQCIMGLHFAVCCNVLQRDAGCCSLLQCAAGCCSVLQCAAVCCSVLLECCRIVAARCRVSWAYTLRFVRFVQNRQNTQIVLNE